MSSTIDAPHILKDLAELWVSLSKEKGEPSAGVLRACTMTLLVVAEEADDAAEIGETLAALMPEHPSRAIVVRLRPAGDRELSARVFAQCWMPFGVRRQICCEQIEIVASDAGLPELVPVILPLTVPDLPVILWCRSARAFGLHAFPQLASVARKLVIDSAGFTEPRDVLNTMAGWSGQVLADLSWTRMTRWRELVSQIFENRGVLAKLPQIAELRIGYMGDRAPVSAWYLAAWLQEGLAQGGAHPQLIMEHVEGESARRVRRVELVARNGRETHVSVDRANGCAETRVGSLVNRTSLPPPTDYMLMREELSIPRRDPVYERTLVAAAALAASLSQA